MRRSLAIAAVSGSLLAGSAVGVLVGNPAISGAEEAAPSSSTEPAKPSDARRGHIRKAVRAGLETAATALGLTGEELRTQLKAGQTLGQIADARGVSRTDVVAALTGEAQAHLAEAVAAGRITQEQADARLEALGSRLPELLDRQLPGPRGDHGPGKRAGGPHRGGMRLGGPSAGA